jgi:hypothetical protein
MSETLDYLVTFALLPLALRRFLGERPTPDQDELQVRERLAQREERFLRLVERSVFGYPRSPYLALFKLARCELGDLRALVRDRSLDGALRALREAGVYVSFEEFKGRVPIVRQGVTVPTTSRSFDNPFTRRHYTVQTGGSTGVGVTVQVDLEHLADMAVYLRILLGAHGVLDAPTAVCVAMLPGGAFSFLLQRAYLGLRTERWYSPIGWRESKEWPKYNLATLYILLWANAFGARIPWPTVLKSSQAWILARWMRGALARRGRCLYYGFASLALRACIAAEQAGWDLTGLTIRAGGEPLTPAKAAGMRRAGARPFAGYGMAEAGTVGIGCVRPNDDDDVHLTRDAFALVTHPHQVESVGMTVPAFNITTLLDSTPKLMLNYQLDDYGIVEERDCGCPIDAYGYTTHLRQIRSYSKLLGESVTLIGNEMVRIVEEVLPALFGGSPLDYQLLEQEDEQGLTRLYLIIHPRIAIADEAQVVEAVLNGMRESSPTADAARLLWQDTRTIQIKRMEPKITGRGKFFPLHIQRSS